MEDERSKNRYALLGNDPEQDSDQEPEPPVKVVDRTAPRRGKRDGPAEPQATAAPSTRGGRGGRRLSGNEGAIRDRDAGAQANRSRPTDEAPREGGATRGGGVKNRDGRGNLIRDDRQPRSDRQPSSKQYDQGWGSKSGESSWGDEKAGESIARTEEQQETAEGGAEGGEKEVEPEDKSKSYADYMAELTESKNEELGSKPARKANEGAKADKMFGDAKELKKDEDEDAYIKGKEEKAKRERQRKEKAYVDVDLRYVEPARPTRGEFRGGRGRGGDRGGDRGDRGDRGGGDRGRGGGERGGGDRGRGGGERGGFDRGRGGGERGRGGPRARGDFRGRGDAVPRGDSIARGGRGPTVDEKNFPSLGATSAK